MERQAGGITYQVLYKNVKNINLRVKPDGAVLVSAPHWLTGEQVDTFVMNKAGWIQRARERSVFRFLQNFNSVSQWDETECKEYFQAIIERWYPHFAHVLPQPPRVKIRAMTSCWGVCHPTKGYVTLHPALMTKPLAVAEYVVLHELVHFIEPNHQAGFHAWMARLMPDYQTRRKMLRQNAEIT